MKADKKRKGIVQAAALFALVLLLCLPVRADGSNIDYSGELDPQTNQPVTPENPNGNSHSNTSRVMLSSSMYYDWSTHDFVYPVSNTLNEIHCSAADGMILNKPVTLSTGADTSIVVYLNGSEYTGSLSTINQVGEYVVSSKQAGDTVRVLSFILVGTTTNAVSIFSPPDGFYLTAATRDGESIYFDRYNVRMDQEGLYHIEYECIATDVVYTLETTIDRTPPSLTFEETFNEDLQVRSALHFSGLEKGDSVLLYRSGVQVKPELSGNGKGAIYDSGVYEMYVFDAAGNKAEYHFSILMYFTVSSLVFIAFAVLILIGTGIYILVKRRKLKIG